MQIESTKPYTAQRTHQVHLALQHLAIAFGLAAAFTPEFQFHLFIVRTGGLELGKDEEGVFKDALYELAKTSPKGIEQQLAEDGQVLELLDEKLNIVTGAVATLSKEVLQRLDDMQKEITEVKERIGGDQNQRNRGNPDGTDDEGGQQST